MKQINKHLLIILFLLTLFVWVVAFSLPDGKLHLVFCNVGQGDAVLLSKGFSQMLIDGGPDDKVLDCLSHNVPFFDHTLELVFLTHPESDHLTGIVSVLDKYEVKYFFDSLVPGNSSTYEVLLTRLKTLKESSGQGEKLKVVSLFQGRNIGFERAKVSVLWPEESFVKAKLGEERLYALKEGRVLGDWEGKLNLNDFSLVLLINYQGKKILLMGDADSGVQDDILKNGLEKVDLLKFPHHGSKTGMDEEFLRVIKPKEAVISVGKNSFGHPTSEALELLEKYKVKVRRTDQEGEIHYQF
jgi:beta-lactamase superfamily II metal-dependent hydrolase